MFDLINLMHADLSNSLNRSILADCLADLGRTEEESLLRASLDEKVYKKNPVDIRQGKIVRVRDFGKCQGTAMIFSIEDKKYIVPADEDMDYREFHKAYDSPDYKFDTVKCDGINLDGMEPRFYIVCNVDCSGPPLWIIRADNENDAFAWFIEETDQCLIPEEDLADYDPNEINYNDSGKPCDTNSVNVRRVTLESIRDAIPHPGNYSQGREGYDIIGLKDFSDYADAVEYVNQEEDYADSSKGEWYYADDNMMIIYYGTFGNDHSPGASHGYTNAEVYGTWEEYQKNLAEWEAKDEYLDGPDYCGICGNEIEDEEDAIEDKYGERIHAECQVNDE